MKKLTQKEFIEKAKNIHKNKYDYSKVIYKNYREKVCIICPEHGEFWQKPQHHLYNHGCPTCGGREKNDMHTFIEKAKKVHGDKYDYSKVQYINNKTKVCIICPEHGEFYQKPNDHLSGKGCEKCAGRNLTTKEWIESAIKVHKQKYDYSKVEYINGKTKVCIICPEHGEFWQTPQDHLSKHGCPYCHESKLEKEVEKLLMENNILFEKQKTFDWLLNRIHMRLDFFIPNINIAIECQGIQHYEPIKRFGGEKGFIKTVERDLKKAKLCEENGIKLIYFTHYKNINKTGNIYCNKDTLLKELKL
jgi:hypothetical protein